MNNRVMKRLKKYSNLFSDSDIKEILKEELNGYKIKSFNEDLFEIYFHNDEDNITKRLTFNSNNIFIEKNKNQQSEIVTITNGPIVKKDWCEIRFKGLLFKKTRIYYGYSILSKKVKNPMRIIQDSYAITRDDIIKYGIFSSSYNANDYCKYLSNFSKDKLNDISSNVNNFVAIDDYYSNDDSNLHSSFIEVDGTEVSFFYENVEGKNRLLRILDLYNGKINYSNIDDIKKIKLREISSYAFGLREAWGVNEREDESISEVSIWDSYKEIGKTSRLLAIINGCEKSSLDKLILRSRVKSLDRFSILSVLFEKEDDFIESRFNLNASVHDEVVNTNDVKKYTLFRKKNIKNS